MVAGDVERELTRPTQFLRGGEAIRKGFARLKDAEQFGPLEERGDLTAQPARQEPVFPVREQVFVAFQRTERGFTEFLHCEQNQSFDSTRSSTQHPRVW